MASLDTTILKKLKPADYENLAKAIGKEPLNPHQLKSLITSADQLEVSGFYSASKILEDRARIKSLNPKANLNGIVSKLSNQVKGNDIQSFNKIQAFKGYALELITAGGTRSFIAFGDKEFERLGIDVVTKDGVFNCKLGYGTLLKAAESKVKGEISSQQKLEVYLVTSYQAAQKLFNKQYPGNVFSYTLTFSKEFNNNNPILRAIINDLQNKSIPIEVLPGLD